MCGYLVQLLELYDSTIASYPSYLIVATGTCISANDLTIDANHPYFLHPSDHLGLILLTITLTEQNYNKWF